MWVRKCLLPALTVIAWCYIDAGIACRNSIFIIICTQSTSTPQYSTSQATTESTTEANSASLASTSYSVKEPDRMSKNSPGSHADPPTNGMTPQRCSIGTILAVLGVWICLRVVVTEDYQYR